MTDSDRKMKGKLINIGGREAEIDKDYHNYNSTRHISTELKFPNIDIFKTMKNTKYSTLYNENNNIKNIKINSKNNLNTYYNESESDIPKITSKINSKNKYSNSNSVKKNKYIYKTINYNTFNDIQNSNLILTSITPKFNIKNDNNISNINNIYNKNDYLHDYFIPSNDKNNKRYMITIKNLKNTESDITLNEEEKNSILNLLEKRTFININNIKNNTIKNNKYKDEFKEFLKGILKQYKNKYKNKVKKKININSLLINNQIKNKYNTNILTNYNLGINERMKSDNDKNKNKNCSIILRNEFLKSKLNNKNYRMLTEEIKLKKKNIFFDMYKFKKNQKIMKTVQEELINVQNAIKKSFDKYKKNIDDEPVNIS